MLGSVVLFMTDIGVTLKLVISHCNCLNGDKLCSTFFAFYVTGNA